MKAHTEYFTFRAKKRELLHITDKVAEVLERSGINEGFLLVSACTSRRASS